MMLVLCVVSTAHSEDVAHAPQRLRVSGTPEQIGEQVGRKYRDVIRQFRTQFIGLAMTYTGKNRNELFNVAADLALALHRDDLAEIKGVARGAKISYDDALIFNLFYAIVVDRIACRQLVVWGPATADGKLIHARNLDWFDYGGSPMQKRNLILNIKPKGANEYILLTWPGAQGALTGTNDKGITIAFNQLLGATKTKRRAEPVFFTMKRILRTCSTLAQATKLFRDANPVGNGSVMISDARARKAIVIEMFDGKIGMRDPRNCMIGNANHATREAGLTNVSRFGSPGAPVCPIAAAMGKLDVEKAKRVMADPRVCQQINLQSVLFVPEHNVMYFASGATPAAQKAPFRRFTLFRDD